jgi:beta-lactamase class A
MSLAATSLTSLAEWSVLVRDLATGEVLLAHRPERALPAASLGKLALLVAVAAAAERGDLALDEPLDRASVPPVTDSGIWQHLAQPTLSIADAALLVGAASDNLATNVLLQRLAAGGGGVGETSGADAVASECARLGIQGVRLHRPVRDAPDTPGPGEAPAARAASDPTPLSSVSAAGAVDLLARLDAGTVRSPAVSAQVLAWLRHSLDLSMVASAFGVDPLAHGHDDELRILNKTGTDAGVRADAGIVRGARRGLVYAAIAEWKPGADARDAVLASMRGIGAAMRSRLEAER